MAEPLTIFEVSWEVANKVGGIHTVLSTKAQTLVERLGDRYVAIGPWLLGAEQDPPVFEDEPGFAGFAESCRKLGVPVRVGRWLIPGRPRTILVSFSGLFEKKDGVLAGLWERSQVDSIFGAWDYVEPVLFGHAAGLVIERWWDEYVAWSRGEAVAQFHEWMTGSGLLYLRERAPAIGTVFTTHATMLGRAIASTGRAPIAGLEGRSPADTAKHYDVVAKHSMEGACARGADAFTTVSELTAEEAAHFHERRAEPLLPNGIDLDVMDAMSGGITRERATAALRELATRFLGQDSSGAALLAISGRYEFHNKGIDVLLDALGLLNAEVGRPAVVFALVPANNSGLRAEMTERLRMPIDLIEGPIGISTHNLFDPERDPIGVRCAERGLTNGAGTRVKVVQVPIYLRRGDGLLDLPYEAVLRGFDLTCFPSFYEPWGYTPEESLAAGVPTITTDCAGFGRWARDNGLGAEDGVMLLAREGVEDQEAARGLCALLADFLERPRDRERTVEICRRTAQRTAWSDLVRHYETAFERARAALRERVQRLGAPPFRPRPIEAGAPLAASARPKLSGFDVAATLPPELAGLERLAANYWWAWNADARALFENLAPRKWRSTGHNPTLLLREAFREDLEARAADPAYRAELARVLARFDAYLAEPPAPESFGKSAAPMEFAPGAALGTRRPIAYFCAEFGLHESLPIYGGGLGILAGDHLKSASDLGLPLVGVGLFYRRGYLRQRIGPAGEQVALEVDTDPHDVALELVRDAAGQPLRIAIELPGSTVRLQAWRAAIGRVSLYLLDSDLPENRAEDRALTAELYGGDHENRLRQEIALGRGGVRLLSALGLEPGVVHLNEGHAAFASLERVHALIREQGLTFDEARVAVRANTAFTTHTPVPAGHDRFGEDPMRRHFSDAASWVGVPWERFYALGQAEDDHGAFNMTYLALSFAGWVNGVSALHGEISRRLLHPYWPKLLESEVPVESITNGVHLPTWTNPELAALLGAAGRALDGRDFARAAGALDAAAFGQVRGRARTRLMDLVRSRLHRGFIERGDSPALLERMLHGLDGGPLLIGFARRFAPYKRAELLFHDPARLAAILGSETCPVRILVAGKAHPRDPHGQELLKKVFDRTRAEPFVGKVFFLEDYDADLARAMVQGVDVWLNNPMHGLEASGTSGMKAAANGALHLSIADGWWPEAADGENGWSIGGAQIYPNQAQQDELDAALLYRLLEEEVAPLYFERDSDGVARRWFERVRRCLATIPPVFDTDRMVGQYLERAYAPLAAAHAELARDRFAPARARNREHQRVRRGFGEIKVLGTKVSGLGNLKVGDEVLVQVDLDLGHLLPDDVVVEFLHGHARGEAQLSKQSVLPLVMVPHGHGMASFVGTTRMARSGTYSYGIRVRARERGLEDGVLRDLVLWA